MKKDLLFLSIIFLGVSIIISSIILSRSKIEQLQTVSSNLYGSVGINQSIANYPTAYSGDIIDIEDATTILLYSSTEILKQDLKSGDKSIPYVKINDNYLFSKKALEEWIYSKSLSLE